MIKIRIRKFDIKDIPNKVRWINNSENNKYLHYDIPLEYQKTLDWYQINKTRTDRYDAVIEADGIPVGVIGLLSIDLKNRKAEYYVTIGETHYKGKGIAYKATMLILEYAFLKLHLHKIYLYTEAANVIAHNLFEKAGFRKEGILKNDIFSKGKYVDRYAYGMTKDDYMKRCDITPIQHLGVFNGNYLYIKRDDLIPYSFGGNKARKGRLFFEEIDQGGYDCVITYGSSQSNHCRIISNMAAARNLPCYLVSPNEVCDISFNGKLMELFGAEVIRASVEQVHDTIEKLLEKLKAKGKHPYFIPGGGHGNIGTLAYLKCYEEIAYYERKHSVHFDYIFFATGTGTTQAGLVCGQLINEDDRKIIGISIARKNPRGRNVIVESIREFLQENDMQIDECKIQEATIFLDDYTGNGYGKDDKKIENTIKEVITKHGIPLDSTYTGKAYYGMEKYIESNNVKGNNILFIHTGGTPLFFDTIGRL